MSEARRLTLRSTAAAIRTIPTTSANPLRRRVLAYATVLVGCMVARYPRPFSFVLVPARPFRIAHRIESTVLRPLGASPPAMMAGGRLLRTDLARAPREVEPQWTYCGGVESQPEGEWPVLIVSQGVRSVPRLAVHGGGEGECARGAAVGVNVGQVCAQNRLGLIDCVAVGDLCRSSARATAVRQLQWCGKTSPH